MAVDSDPDNKNSGGVAAGWAASSDGCTRFQKLLGMWSKKSHESETYVHHVIHIYFHEFLYVKCSSIDEY
jgi:hypothetical protein